MRGRDIVARGKCLLLFYFYALFSSLLSLLRASPVQISVPVVGTCCIVLRAMAISFVLNVTLNSSDNTLA